MLNITPELTSKFDKEILDRQLVEKPRPVDFRLALTAAKETEEAAELFREFMLYDPVSGRFTWRKDGEGRGGYKRKAGAEAGTCVSAYVVLTLNCARYLAHRVAWLLHYGKWPEEDVDHIDRNKQNNAINNLRLVNNRLNHANRGDNNSGFVGVLWEKSRSKWKAYIRVGYVMHNIGRYDSAEDAFIARAHYLERVNSYLLTHKTN